MHIVSTVKEDYTASACAPLVSPGRSTERLPGLLPGLTAQVYSGRQSLSG